MTWAGGIRALAALVVVLCAALAGCGGSTAAEDEVVVYVSDVLKDNDDVRAIQLALDEAGGRAGRFEVRLETMDSADPRQARPTSERLVRNAERAVADPRAVAYLGDGVSPDTIQTLPITSRAGLLQICATCSYVGLTRKAAPGEPARYQASGRPTFARMIPADHIQGAAVAAYMRREGVRRAAVLHDGHIYGKGLAAAFADSAADAGVELVFPPRKAADDGDGREALDRGAQALFLAGNYFTTQVADRAAKLDPGLLIFLGDGFASNGFAEDATESSDQARISAPLPPDRDSAATRSFEKGYYDRYGREPILHAYYAYEGMRMVLEAIERAGEDGDDRRAVRDAFFSIPEHDSVVGRFRIDRHGDTTARGYGAYTVGDGELEFVGPVVAGSRAVTPEPGT